MAWPAAGEVFGQACVVSFDSSTSQSSTNSPLSFPITVNGSNRLLVVQVAVEANDGPSSIIGVTYGGAPMSQVLQTVRTSGGNGRQGTYVMTAPALGTNNVIVTLVGNKPFEAGAIDYNGVDPSTPIGAATFTQNNPATFQAVTLTTTTTGSWVSSTVLWYSNSVTVSSFGPGQNERWLQKQGDSAEGDDKTTLTAGSNSVSYTLSANQAADIEAIEIRPCSVAPTASDTPTMTPTGIPTPTATDTPTHTPAYTETNTVTNTPTNSPVPTSTNTSTHTTTDTPVFTPTPTASKTPTTILISTFTPTPTSRAPLQTPTPTPSPASDYRVWPNPFTPALPSDNLAHFDLPPSHGAGEIRLLDIHRRPIRTMAFGAEMSPVWDGKDDSGKLVHGGLYLYLLTVDGQAHRGSVAVLR